MSRWAPWGFARLVRVMNRLEKQQKRSFFDDVVNKCNFSDETPHWLLIKLDFGHLLTCFFVIEACCDIASMPQFPQNLGGASFQHAQIWELFHDMVNKCGFSDENPHWSLIKLYFGCLLTCFFVDIEACCDIPCLIFHKIWEEEEEKVSKCPNLAKNKAQNATEGFNVNKKHIRGCLKSELINDQWCFSSEKMNFKLLLQKNSFFATLQFFSSSSSQI